MFAFNYFALFSVDNSKNNSNLPYNPCFRFSLDPNIVASLRILKGGTFMFSSSVSLQFLGFVYKFRIFLVKIISQVEVGACAETKL